MGRVVLVGLVCAVFVGLPASAAPWWDYVVPAGASERREAGPNGREIIEYRVNGQSVGYRVVDPKTKRVLLEQGLRNGQPHGVLRLWHEAGWLQTATAFRDGTLHGPRFVWRADGTVERSEYYIAGKEVTGSRYIAAQKTDASLPPANLYDRYFAAVPPPTALSAADDQLVAKCRAALADADKAYRAPLDLTPTARATNPRAATLAKVWEAAQIAERIVGTPTRVQLLLECANAQRGYAGRLFGYVGKTEFIANCARILARVPAAIDALADNKAQSQGYLGLAEAWRELAKIALWGDHAHNKHACDAESKRCYDRAVALDRANQAAVKARDEANRPQPPRPTPPPVFAQAKPIGEERWEQAGLLRQALLDDTLTRPGGGGNFGYAGVGVDLVVDAGPVTVQVPHQSEQITTVPVGEPHPLFAGTNIRTGATGRARLVYEDRSVFHIRPSASIYFQDSDTIIIRVESFSSGSLVKDVVALFDSRHIRTDLRVSKRGREFLVITPTAVLGPRGTCFEIGRAGGQESVRVFDGAVEARTESDVAYLAPGHQATLSASGAARVATFDAAAALRATWPDAQPSAAELPARPAATPRLSGATLAVYWAPQGAFDLVEQATTIPFGAAHLVARLTYPGLRRGAKVSSTWTTGDRADALLTQQLTAEADGAVVQTIASMPVGQVFAAGNYEVTVTVAGAGHLRQAFAVAAAPPLGNRQPAAVYGAALSTLVEAVAGMRRGDVRALEAAARRALPDLATALAHGPALPDVLAAHELDRALLALAELRRAADAKQRPAAIIWAERAVAHAGYAAEHAKDDALRDAGRDLVKQIGAILPALRDAK